MINLKSLIVISAIGLTNICNSAQAAIAGLFVEPSLTYEIGATDVNYPTPFSNSSGKADGIGLGARLGLHLSEVFFLGVDARYATPKFTDSSVSYDANAVSTNLGPVLGFQMPIVGLRLWGSYILSADLNPEASGSFDVNFKKGSGYRLGAGFRILIVSLNLEYQEIKYGTANLEQVGPFASTSLFDNVNLENKSWVASVSLPFEF